MAALEITSQTPVRRCRVLLARALGLLALSLVAWASALLAAAPRKIHLRPGELVEVTFPPGSDLAVSRRGVVDLHHAGGGSWQVTGLRGGFVIIDAKDAASGEPREPRLFVQVDGADDDEREALSVEPPGLPAWLCAPPGIRCDRAAGIVSGATDSPAWLLRARAACAAQRNCLCTVELSSVGREAWRAALVARLGPEFDVAVRAGALPELAAACGPDGRARRLAEADARTGGLVADGLAVLACREDAGALSYRLRAKIYLVESAEAQQLGFDTTLAASVSAPAPRADASLLARLDALAASRRAEILGEPVVRLAPALPVKILSGGEFQTIEAVESDHVVRERSSWKQHGLALELTATPLAGGRVRLAYEASLKTRVQGAEPALTVNSVKSQADLPLGEPRLVGSLDLTASGASERTTPGLAALPILGPLFRRAATEASRARLLIWLTVDADGADAAWPPVKAPY